VACQPLRTGSNRGEEPENLFRFVALQLAQRPSRSGAERYGKQGEYNSGRAYNLLQRAKQIRGPAENLREKLILPVWMPGPHAVFCLPTFELSGQIPFVLELSSSVDSPGIYLLASLDFAVYFRAGGGICRWDIPRSDRCQVNWAGSKNCCRSEFLGSRKASADCPRSGTQQQCKCFCDRRRAGRESAWLHQLT
jgi:hypothetical protein